ncbi:MAG: metal ABC transporter permease, partial [Tateyamaria sp.]
SDAISHATLPGVGLAFVVMVAFGGDGRSLVGLLVGASVSAALGLLCVHALTRRTRLGEDAAIGAVLSVFFGFGVVILTVVQTLNAGTQAGLEGFLLGSTAGMLRADAILLAISAALVLALVLVMRRPFELAAFDPGYAQATGWSLPRIDLAMMGIVLVVTVVGLKVVGLILIVALLIVPAVTARFWTERADHVVLIAGIVGGLSGYIGAALSAVAPDLPTGPIVVLVGFLVFLFSLLFSPRRGVLASVLTHMAYQRRVHIRQGLLALANDQPIYEALTHRLLSRSGLILPDGVPTPEGQAAASKAQLDESRWAIVRADQAYALAATRYDGLTPIEDVLTPDQLRDVDRQLAAPQVVA